MGGGGATGGLFGAWNSYMKYKNLKNQEYSEREGLRNNLNQANNNVQITGEQAPLVPLQSAESFAARGVGQSSFGNGTGDQWAQTAPQTPPNPGAQYANPSTGLQTGPGQAGPPGTVGSYRLPTDVSQPAQSGGGQAVGTGLQRARDLASSMVSNAGSQQKAADVALTNYNHTIKNNRHMFYTEMAQDWLNAILGASGMA
jgi:hypothetical protein